MYNLKKCISPFYNIKRIPRKLKKKIKFLTGIHYYSLDNNERMWYYLSLVNNKYHKFIISNICNLNDKK